MLDLVHQRLAQIHMAIAERTKSDKEIMPWTLHELLRLIREVGAFRRERRDASGIPNNPVV